MLHSRRAMQKAQTEKLGLFAEGLREWRILLVRLAGIEPATLGFGGQYSIH